MSVKNILLVLVAVLAIWLGYKERSVLERTGNGWDSCKKLKLGEGDPHWDKEIATTLPKLLPLVFKIMDDRVVGELDDPSPNGLNKRVQHPVSFGCFDAELKVKALNASNAVGMLATEKTYPVTIRLSKNSFDPDNHPRASSIAIKIRGLEGKRVEFADQHPDASKDNKDTQDFVMINSETLPLAVEPMDLVGFHEWFTWKKTAAIGGVIWMVLNEPTLIPRTLAFLLPGLKISVPFLASHSSVHPYGFGNTAAKFGLQPCDPSLQQPTVATSEEYVASVTQQYLDNNDVCMKFVVQKQVDSCDQLIDSIIVPWTTPWEEVGRLYIKKGTKLNFDSTCEGLSFNPGHGLAAHEPLGWIAKIRVIVYNEGFNRRAVKNAAKAQ